MKKELIQSLAATFETHAQQTKSGVEYWLARDQFVDVNKLVDHGLGSPAPNQYRMQGKHHLKSWHQVISGAIDALVGRRYRNCHIRPLAVRPLDYPEREPTPWGFLFSAAGKSALRSSQGRLS